MTIEQIQERLENSEAFKYWSKEVGITFDDFQVIDVKAKKVLRSGSKEIGDYCIMILEDDRLQASYDLTVDSLREKRLQSIKEEA